MRIRTIKPDFWIHPVMIRQPDATKLLAIGLLNYADDEGYFFAEPRLVRASLRPFDEDSTNVRRSLAELSRIGFVSIVEHPTHGPVGLVLSFRKHQRIDRPQKSKISMFYHECAPKAQTEAPITEFDERSSNDRRALVANVALEQGTGNKGTGNREQGNVAADAAVVSVPQNLDTPSFRSAWAEWVAYRQERKLAAYKPATIRAQLTKLAEWGEGAAVEAIRESIRQNWQGIFEPRVGPGASKRPAKLGTDMAHADLAKRHGGTF
jgi:hypothetical protein